MKKALAILLAAIASYSLSACSGSNSKPDESPVPEGSSEESSVTDSRPEYQRYAEMTPEEIVAELTLEQKAAQMVQPAIYNVSEEMMQKNDYGSILSTAGRKNAAEWRETVDAFQRSALESESGIPYVYGQDDIHGVNYCVNAVYFPHNIGQGAANDEALAYQVGLITADEAKLCHMLWNFSPVVAQSADPRWGRTYESYGSDLDTVTKLSTAYTKGLIDGGIIACTKHYFGDGNVKYGTGEQGAVKMLIDRGDAQLSDAEISDLLKVYQAQIDAGVQTIMISHSSLNGVKMHENKEYIMKLKDEMGFEGFIVSDWGSVGNITGATYEEQVIKSVNAGIDMLMETDRFSEAQRIIVNAVGSGAISAERINDAVTRIIRVKKNAGLFEDPLFENMKTVQQETGSAEYRAIAEKLVEESLVLLKNDNTVLPFKEGEKIYITGPAADNCRAQCGGWTLDWTGCQISGVPGVVTILEAFRQCAADYGIEVITDAKEAANADAVLLCIGEDAYAEWYGDTEDLELCGALGLDGNREAIDAAKALGKPTVACILAGRHIILDPDDYAAWDAAVMCYLPGSEGKGISDVLCGCADFTGKLPSPWYASVSQIGTEECFLACGYGLNYGDGFTPRQEPGVADAPSGEPDETDPLAGTKYTAGLFKDGVYTNEYAQIKLTIPGELGVLPVSDSDKRWAETFLLSLCEDEKDRLRETAMPTDACFENSSYSIDVKFLNTKRGVPKNPDCTEAELLDDFRTFLSGPATPPNAEVTYTDRKTVQLGDREYMRDVCEVKADGMHKWYYDYVRRLDDDLICVIEIYTSSDRTPEYYEALFS